MPRFGNSPGQSLFDIGWSGSRTPPTTRPYKTTGDRGGRNLTSRPVANGNWPRGNRPFVRSVTNTWSMERHFMCTMWFARNMEARRTSPLDGWFITRATVRFTAAVRLLGYVDCLSRVQGDRCARF